MRSPCYLIWLKKCLGCMHVLFAMLLYRHLVFCFLRVFYCRLRYEVGIPDEYAKAVERMKWTFGGLKSSFAESVTGKSGAPHTCNPSTRKAEAKYIV